MSIALTLPSEIGFGKEREVKTLLADQWRKLVLIQIRQGAVLTDHSARVPIIIHALLGRGILRVGEEEHVLVPGVIVPVNAHVIHRVQGDPDLAILVTFFRQPAQGEASETTAQFD